jgi:quinol monooxygenase YgiN
VDAAIGAPHRADSDDGTGMHVAAQCGERRIVRHDESGQPSIDAAHIQAVLQMTPCQARAVSEDEMASITTENRVATLINVFTVDPKDQQRLVNLLTSATERTIKHLPGFVSASIHKSTDGARVVNYAQWRSPGDLEAMLKNPDAQAHIKPITELAQADAHLYDVVDTISTP